MLYLVALLLAPVVAVRLHRHPTVRFASGLFLAPAFSAAVAIHSDAPGNTIGVLVAGAAVLGLFYLLVGRSSSFRSALEAEPVSAGFVGEGSAAPLPSEPVTARSAVIESAGQEAVASALSNGWASDKSQAELATFPAQVETETPEPAADDPVILGWPESPKEEPPDPVAAADPRAEPVPAPVPTKRPRGRPRKAAAKLVSPSPVVQSEPVELVEPPLPEPAKAEPVEAERPQPAPEPPPIPPAPFTASLNSDSGWPASSVPTAEPEPEPEPVTVEPVRREWRSPVYQAQPSKRREEPPAAAKATLIEKVAAAPQRPSVSVLERLLTRPAVVDSVSPSGIFRIRMVGWPARILTAYRAAQLALLVSVFLFYDSIFEWLGARMVQQFRPFMTGAIQQAMRDWWK